MRKILTKKAPELSATAIPIPHGANTRPLLAELFDTMYGRQGLGLAANQIGILSRAIVMDVQGLRLAVINPVITPRGKATRFSIESCLSCPGKRVRVKRHKRITLTGYNSEWQPIKHKLSGLAAACAQHEVDHLNGILITDKVKEQA